MKYAARLMLSAPAPIATSVSPSRMCWAAETIACSPLPHSRLTVRQGVPTGSPPSIAATRENAAYYEEYLDDTRLTARA